MSINVWSVRKPWSPLTLCIISDESWSIFTNDWRIIDCKAEDSRRAVDMWQYMSLDIFCIFTFEVGKLVLCSIFPILKNTHFCKNYSYISLKTHLTDTWYGFLHIIISFFLIILKVHLLQIIIHAFPEAS